MKLGRLLIFLFSMSSNFAMAEATLSTADSTPTPALSRLLPVFLFTPDTGVGLGGFLIRNLEEPSQGDPSQVIAFVTITEKNQIIAVLEPKLYWDQGRKEWTGKVAIQDFPSEYYGREKAHLHPDEAEAYRVKSLNLETRFKNIFYQRYFYEVEYGVGLQEFAEVGAKPTPAIAAEFKKWGYKGQQQNLSFGLGHDSRSSKVRATSGHLIRAFYRNNHFKTEQASDREAVSGLDLKTYSSLNDRRSIALQFYAAQMELKDLPFYLLQGLGGNQVLRGFYGNQFRDYAVAYSQAEWRSLWGQDWGYRVFAGVGAHAQRLEDLDQSAGKGAGGIGLDYFIDPKSMNNLRLDLGVSQGIVGVYFLYGNAF